MKTRKIIIFLIPLILILSLFSTNNLINTGEITEEDHYVPGSKKALEFWTRSRAYPQKDIPAEKFYKAFQNEKIVSKNAKNKSSVQASWEEMGPHNVPGRMISVAVNPLDTTILLAGSASGGLWRTDDTSTGYGWRRINTGFPTLGVMAIAINPVDTNVIYIGTGEVYGYNKSIGGTVIRTTRGSYGIGILKTSDGGKTWTKSLDWSLNQQRGVQCIRMHPQNPDTIYAATTEGIYKSVDAGENWNLSLPVLMGEDIIIHPDFPQKVMVSCGNLGSAGSGIYITHDGGNNWHHDEGIPSFSGKTLMDYYASNPNTVFASIADSLSGIGLFRTDTFGEEWVLVNSWDVPTLAVAIDPIFSDHVYIGNDLGVYASTDAGQTWNGFNSGLPESVIAMDLNISPVNRKLRVATHGNGAYQTSLIQQFDGPFLHFTVDHSDLAMVMRPINLNINVKNWGTEAQSDPHTLKMRIIDQNNSEVFSKTESICCLDISEERPVPFDKIYAPQEPGEYDLQIINFGSTQNPIYDTTHYNLRVIPITTISNIKITKKYSKYQEIKSVRKINRNLPTKVDLPFRFVYDGYEYDKALISYRGWVELGSGEDGTERGLSTPTELNPKFGGSEDGRITSLKRPSKVLAPWWGKLFFKFDGIIRWDVSYITEGLPPSRVFVVQWKDIFAAEESSTTINFQLRLYETTDKIEFHYGPVSIGTYNRFETMIGLEDHISGDFHFYDIIGGGSSLGHEAVRYLNPLTDWPGPDSIFVIYTRSFTDIAWENTTGIALRQNYPNPFNDKTTIEFKLPGKTPVELKIYNILGQEIKTLVKTVEQEGTYKYVWDGKNKIGNPVAAGMYILRLQTPNENLIKKMIYLK